METSNDEKLAALRMVAELADKDEAACREAELFEDAKRARGAAAWCRATVQEMEIEPPMTLAEWVIFGDRPEVPRG